MSNRLETNNDGVIAAAPSDVQWIEAGADAKTPTALRRFQMTGSTSPKRSMEAESASSIW